MPTIRPSALPASAGVASGSAIIVDTGSAVEKATPGQIVDSAIPLASQAEAQAGTDNAKRVSPLRVKQAIDALAVSAEKLAATGAGEGADLVGFETLRAPASAEPIEMTERIAIADCFLWDMMTPAQRSATKSDAPVDITAPFQAGINAATNGEGMYSGAAGGTKFVIPAGRFLLNEGIANSFRADNSIIDDRDLRRMNIEGAGSCNTELNFAGGAGTTAITLKAFNNADGRLMGSYIRGIRLTQNPISARLATGIRLETIAGFGLDDVKISGFDLGLYLKDVLEFHAVDTHVLGNSVGLRAELGVWTRPNVISWLRGALSGNLDIAADIKNGSCVTFQGTRFEGNGTDRATDLVIDMDGAPTEGRAWLTVHGGCYFEGNKTASEMRLTQDTGNQGAVRIEGNTFNHIDIDKYPSTSVDMFGAGTGRSKVSIEGNGWLAGGTYVADSSTPYIIQSDHFDVSDHDNLFDAAIGNPVTNGFPVHGRDMFHVAAKALVINNGVASIPSGRNGNIASVTRDSIGQVTIVFKRAMASTEYLINLAPYFNDVQFGFVSLSTTGLTITTSVAGALADANFTLEIVGDYA